MYNGKYCVKLTARPHSHAGNGALKLIQWHEKTSNFCFEVILRDSNVYKLDFVSLTHLCWLDYSVKWMRFYQLRESLFNYFLSCIYYFCIAHQSPPRLFRSKLAFKSLSTTGILPNPLLTAFCSVSLINRKPWSKHHWKNWIHV